MKRMSTAQRLAGGMALILAKEPTTEIDIHDDCLFVGTYDDDRYTAADRLRLEQLGWYECEESWSFRT